MEPRFCSCDSLAFVINSSVFKQIYFRSLLIKAINLFLNLFSSSDMDNFELNSRKFSEQEFQSLDRGEVINERKILSTDASLVSAPLRYYVPMIENLSQAPFCMNSFRLVYVFVIRHRRMTATTRFGFRKENYYTFK